MEITTWQIWVTPSHQGVKAILFLPDYLGVFTLLLMLLGLVGLVTDQQECITRFMSHVQNIPTWVLSDLLGECKVRFSQVAVISLSHSSLILCLCKVGTSRVAKMYSTKKRRPSNWIPLLYLQIHQRVWFHAEKALKMLCPVLTCLVYVCLCSC